jgi:hypothetical protein
MNQTRIALRYGMQIAILALIVFGCNNKPGLTVTHFVSLTEELL